MTPTEPSPSISIPFWQAFWFWLKLGCISFGGPAGQIALMHNELVEKRRWISEGRFLHALNYCMLLPGPEAQQLATYLGWLMHRTVGGIIAGLLFILPSLLLLVLLSWGYLVYGEHPWVAALFYGIKPAIAAIVLHAAWRIGGRVMKHPLLWAIAVAAFVAIFAFKLPFPLIVLFAALIGFIGSKMAPAIFSQDSHSATQKSYGPALIDDTTPTPAHALFRWSRFVVVVSCGLLLWAVPVLLLVFTFGWQHQLTQMSWFFTKAALLTFGGAYAVLPYVYQGAVDKFGWLTPGQMMDGLALGETTPGPLIMVVVFVAFVGAYVQASFGPDLMGAAGVTAALLVSWFTFLPSFIFTLAGGPLVESTQGKLQLTAPLTAISAAVVGVIVNLALFFAYHVLWPTGFAGVIDWQAVFISILAALALFVARQGLIRVIAGAAVLGFSLSFWSPY
ncbi:MAG: chromate efflux transporter [Gammaproteobacteria bacterium]|nr:chromate efflux transporter [Gammaproteobacteria bacterium]MBU2056918.1 chromate efflux transporter [Gammaproteobacteria bacterium]MBU2174550.1 chromate efflux transporter [Gammaproteobacteria bacterium]MBU2248242.1 chromate efflux transporter [Gammaproteobacteria bacterium]MBU2343753.1 chromate efflux transporter [Gammaproteobacteria bacterium]